MRKDETVFVLDNGVKRIKIHLSMRGEVWYFRFQWDGKRIFKTAQTALLDDAKLAAEKCFRETSMTVPTAGSHPIRAMVTRYLEERWPKKTLTPQRARTRRDQESRLNVFMAFRSDYDVGRLDLKAMRRLIRDYYIARRKVVVARTIKSDSLVLHAFCSWLIHSEIVQWDGNPASRDVQRLDRIPIKIELPLTPDEQQALLRATWGTSIWPLVAIGLGAGLRPIEAVRLEWEQVNVSGNTIKVGAKGRERIVKVEPALWQFLTPGTGPVWPHIQTHAEHLLRDIRIKKGLPEKFNFASLRRTASFRFIQRHEPLQYALNMGHSLAVAQRYYADFKRLEDIPVLDITDWDVGPNAGKSVTKSVTAISA